MRRRIFVTSLAAAIGGASVVAAAPADAGLDEARVGMESFLQLRDDGEILFDSPYYTHLNEVGAVIARTVAPRYAYPLRYFIVKGDSANAFSIPGGDIYVNEPLLRMAVNRDELAGVLAHETGHMVLHHVAKGMEVAKTTNILGTIGSIAAQVLLGPIASLGAQYALETAAGAQDSNVQRHIEAQADEEGARIMAATGVYNPWGMVWFLRKMIAKYGDSGALWMRSHPFDRARIADLERLFASDPATFGKFDKTDRGNASYW